MARRSPAYRQRTARLPDRPRRLSPHQLPPVCDGLHSLRAGFLTSAAAGASIWKIREVSRHKSVQVLSDYVRNSDLLRDHAGKGFL